MQKPVILTVDDDPEVLRAIERDLKKHYDDRYRVLRADSGRAALDLLRRLQQRNDAVALLLVDHRMPEMNGVEMLQEAMKLYPNAKRTLLTAYADTDAAIKAINDVQLNHYLLKPWDPPEQELFPVLDDLHNTSYDWKIPPGISNDDEKLRQWRTQRYMETLSELKPGLTMVIMHCTAPGDTFAHISSSGPIRKSDMLAMLDPKFQAFLKEQGFIVTTWKEAMERRRRVR